MIKKTLLLTQSLCRAIQRRNVDLDAIEKLINAGADVNNPSGLFATTPLMWAIEAARNGSKLTLVQFLLAHGADANLQDYFGATPLMNAAWEGNLPIVQLLIKAGADINKISNDNWTTLMKAVFGRDDESAHSIIQCLIKAGAKTTMQRDSKTVLVYAIEKGKPARYSLLIEHMMKLPNKKQQDKLDYLYWAMKKTGFCKDLFSYLKPYISKAIKEENEENPEQSIVYQEILKIKSKKTKEELLEQYYPNQKKSKCVIC